MADFNKGIEKAQKLLQRGKIQEALEEYLSIYNENPTDVELLRIIADLYLQTNRVEEAVQAFQVLIEHSRHPTHFSKALFYHRKIIKLQPENPERIVDLAHFLVQNNKIPEAVQEYWSAAALYTKQNRNQAALHCYERVVEMLPDETRYQEILGDCAAANQQVALAERAWLTAARQHLEKKDTEAARAAFKRGLEINPSNVDTIVMLTRLDASEGRWEAVVKPLESALEEHPLHSDMLEELGDAYLHLNQLDKAELMFSRLFQVKPESYGHLVTLAEQMVAAQNPSGAYTTTMKVKEYCFRIHQYPVVTGLLEAIAKQDPSNVTVLSQLAAVHLSLNNREAYRHCLEKMFDAYITAESYSVAAEVLDNLINVNPSDEAHATRLDRIKPKLPPATAQSLEQHLEKMAVYRREGDPQEPPAAAPRGITPAVAIPKSNHEVVEDLFLQAELFLKYQMNDRALVPLNKLEELLPLPEEFGGRYAELCESLGQQAKFDKAAPAAFPAGAPAAAASPSPPEAPQRPVQTTAGREIEMLAAIHRKIHMQQGAKAVLYSAVNELGKFLKITRCFAALSSSAKPASTYIEYCVSGRGKSDVNALLKLLQFCESTVVVTRRPLVSDRAEDDAVFASIQPDLRVLGVLSLVVWPLVSQNQVLGYVGMEQGDRIRSWTGEEILILQTVSEQVALALAHVKLRHLVKTLAVIDEDTGLIGRHSFFDCLMSEIDHAQKQASTLALALIEVSHFDDMVRQRGAFFATQVLRDFSQFIMAHTRETDIAVKFDRSVIAMILPETTYSEAEWVIQKFRNLFSSENLDRFRTAGSDSPPSFFSASAEALVTPHHDPADSATDVVFRAEQGLAQNRATPVPATFPLDQSLQRR